MHAKSFGKPEHEVMIGKEDFSVLAKNLIDEHNGESDQFSIYKNPDGMNILLTNLPYPNLRMSAHEDQTVFHLSWDETEKLRNFLTDVLNNEKRHQ